MAFSTSSGSNRPVPRKLHLPPFEKYVGDLLKQRGLSITFPPDIEAAALGAISGDEKYVAPNNLTTTLVDLTDRPYITVDNDDSMDLDQAMFIAPWYGPPPRRGRPNGAGEDKGGILRERRKGEPHQSEFYLVSYALADGHHYVPPTSPLFQAALDRGGASFYLPSLCIPMLPRSLSEDAMSLNENQVRRALVFEMIVDAETGQVQHTKPIWANVKSIWKGSYRLVQEYYDTVDSIGNKKRYENLKDKMKHNPIHGAPYEETVVLLRRVGQLRRRLMRSRNIIEFHRSETGIRYDATTGKLVKHNTERYKSELFNEQISLMSNMEGARLLDALDVVEDLVGLRDDVSPIYRYQDAPRKDQVDTLVSLIEELILLHSLDESVFRWIPRGSNGSDFGGEFLGDYLKRLHHRVHGDHAADDNGPMGAHPMEADVLRAIERQAVVTNVGAHFGGEVRPHYSLRVDAYARFSSPMRELVGCFTHKQLWDGVFAARLGVDTSVNDPHLRDKVIDAAAKAKSIQRRLSGAAHIYLMDAFFAPDLELEEPQRPRRHGVIVGIDSTAQRKKRRRNSRMVYVKIEELEVRVSVRDIESIYGVEYGPATTIGKYGVCVKIIPTDEGVKQQPIAPAFYVGQSVNLSVYDHADKYWVFKIEPCDRK